jgi:hypothetical protein
VSLWETRCDECGGLGVRDAEVPAPERENLHPDDWPQCGACDGQGYHLSSAGRDLLRFIDRWVAVVNPGVLRAGEILVVRSEHEISESEAQALAETNEFLKGFGVGVVLLGPELEVVAR